MGTTSVLPEPPTTWHGAAIDQAVLEGKLGRRIRTRAGRTRVETADEILERVATTLSAVEARYGAAASTVRQWEGTFRRLMSENRFWPSGRILNNCGARQGQLASCFVLPLTDDFSDIFATLAVAAGCHRTGGGTGFDLSPLRERGAHIRSAQAAGASGPVSFLHLFDAETTVTMQGGKMRGANLASLSVRHPDIEFFVKAKSSGSILRNFNLSVSIDDEFMRVLADDGTVQLVSPLDGRVVRTIRAADLWQQIAECACQSGDPGVLFLDAVNRANPLVEHLGPIRTTNPCGEQTLYPYEASNLGSINLTTFLRVDGNAEPEFDWNGLEQTVVEAVRLLDNAIDASRYPHRKITNVSKANRRLGLGVMGFADLLVGMGIPYDSEAALDLVDRLGSRIREAAWWASRELAAQRGPFPNWHHTGWSEPARNCAVTTIAPTGTISMVAGCSSGIEPRFAAVWNKDVLTDEGVTYADHELVDEVVKAVGSTWAEAYELVVSRSLDELLPARARARFRYAHDIAPDWHVRVAAQWQRYIDNAVSKTVNLPASAAPADVAEVFRLSWELGSKGCSVYRQGSRSRDLLEPVRVPGSDIPRQSKALMADAAARVTQD